MCAAATLALMAQKLMGGRPARLMVIAGRPPELPA